MSRSASGRVVGLPSEYFNGNPKRVGAIIFLAGVVAVSLNGMVGGFSTRRRERPPKGAADRAVGECPAGSAT